LQADFFPAGAMITGYDGELISREEALLRRQNGRDGHIARCVEFAFHNHCVDGIRAELFKPEMAGGSACNHRDGSEANAKLVHFEPPNERVEVQAVKDIYWGGGRGGKLQLVMLRSLHYSMLAKDCSQLWSLKLVL